MPDIQKQYENDKNKLIAALSKKIQLIYQQAIQRIQVSISTVTYKGTKFNLAEYPALKKRVDAELRRMHTSIYAGVVNGIEASWSLSNKKNDFLVDQRLKGKRLKKGVTQILYDPNRKALEAFKARSEKGLDLSGRVWNSLDPFPKEIEQTVGIGLGQGRSAADIAKDLKKYLNEPDKLFRRVRGEDGKLHLSAAARNYNPGQGVYRSSYKNALRVSRTETNIAYRSADHTRWQKLPFVIGFEIKTSNSHPKFDICDELAGEYPKDFLFTGWHPQCLCYKVPKLASNKDFEKMEDAILAGEDPSAVSTQQITEPPKGFKDFLEANKERMSRWKNKPYWMRDNPAHVSSVTPTHNPAIKNIVGSAPAADIISTQFSKISASIKKQVGHALSSIDKVHGDGKLDDIPIKKSRSKQKNAYFARFNNGRAAEIGLTSIAKNPAFSIVHEMGHYLDLYSIGQKGDFGSMQINSPMGKVIKAALASNTIQNIKKIISDGSVDIGENSYPVSWSLHNHLNYLIDPKEIWARAYSQFIAKRSNSVEMQQGIKDLLESEKTRQIPYSHQWQDDDFGEIEKEIEKMFVELGWMTNQ
jgi:hypothetical protein